MIKTTKDKEIIHAFGFRSEKEFTQDAVKEKVARLKSMLFSRISEKVKRGLGQSGTTADKILRDFENIRHS